jgi:hypothetical protein
MGCGQKYDYITKSNHYSHLIHYDMYNYSTTFWYMHIRVNHYSDHVHAFIMHVCTFIDL